MQGQYRHVAVPYEGRQQFLSCCAAMADRAVAHDEQLMFLLPAGKVDALRGTLDGHPTDIAYLDVDEHVRNPGRFVTLLDGFRAGAGGRRCVSVHEPALDGTSASAAESRLGESLLNSPALQSWNLAVLCLYDTDRLDAAARTEMHRSHPAVIGEGDNPTYEPELASTLFAERLPDVPADAASLEVRGRHVAPAREFVRGNAGDLAPERREDLVLAASEVITNSVKHGGGRCLVAMWDEDDSVVCDMRDAGHIADPLVGRLLPAPDATAGRGLWLANHICDLVQIRSSQAGTTVRLRIDR